ncbi:MAG: hypothetical protein ACYTGH_15365 [Planctomycetota bacterium]
MTIRHRRHIIKHSLKNMYVLSFGGCETIEWMGRARGRHYIRKPFLTRGRIDEG